MKKFYCFVDESGQDTKGEIFFVTIVLKESENLDLLEQKLEIIEKETGKNTKKWGKTPFTVKKEFLTKIIETKGFQKSIFYSEYKNSTNFTVLISLTIAKAIFTKNETDYSVKIIIDGLNDKEREKVTRELKRLTIKYERLRGMRDQSSVFLRLADAVAGLLRDAYEKQGYASSFVQKLKLKEILLET